MYEYLLPIGTVVKLNGATRDLMIFGYLQQHPAFENKIFDYIGVPHPEGYFDPRLQIGFNHSQIGDVIFTGLDDDNHKALLKSLDLLAQKHQMK